MHLPFSDRAHGAAVERYAWLACSQPHPCLFAEFDPYFNYRVTQFLTKEGFYDTWNWFDTRTWYPLGRVVGGTMYPVCVHHTRQHSMYLSQSATAAHTTYTTVHQVPVQAAWIVVSSDLVQLLC